MPLGLPDLRPSRANPEHRAARKQLEREHDAFENYTTFAMKVGVMALLAAAAVIGEAKYDEYKEKEKEKEDKERDRERGRDKERDMNRGRDSRHGHWKSKSRSRSSNSSIKKVRWGREEDIPDHQRYYNPRDYDYYPYGDRRHDRR